MTVSRYLFVSVLTAASLACDENLTDVAGPTPNLQPTLSSIQREIFSTTDSRGRPACVQCHSSAGRVPDGLLSLLDGQSFANLVGRPSVERTGILRVAPGDPDNSYLVRKLEGAQGIDGARMPAGGPYLTAGQIAVIRRWIQLGARND